MADLQKLLKIKCPDCGKTLTVRPPVGAGLGKIRCPGCGRYMIIKFPPEACGNTPLPSGANEPLIPHKLRRLDGAPVMGKTHIPLVEGYRTIGRTDPYSPSDISIDGDDMISRRSVVMTTRQISGGFSHTLEVLSATNPVIVNGNPIYPGRPVTLKPGDRLTLGNTTFVICP